MKKDKKYFWLLGLSVAGLLFAGYIGGVKFFTGTCSFNESCPYFFGYPACYYGFAMYLILTIYSFLLLTGRIGVHKASRATSVVSMLGVLFAGYFTLKELPLLFSDGLRAYALGLPTCALGLIFYILILVISIRIKKNG